MNPHRPNDRKHAVVMGGSMAGLLAARVLSQCFERVTLVERDPLRVESGNRRGVPQARHTHGLLSGGRHALNRLFPGFSEELTAAGAVHGDIIGEGRWFLEGGYHCKFPSGLIGVLVSRPFLEGRVRDRVRALPNVIFRDQEDIEGLTASPDRRRITGVALSREVLSADLVLDATGRGSQTPRWIETLGYPKPVEERVGVGLSYTTRSFRRKPEDAGGDVALIIPPTPAGKRGGVALAQESDRWSVTLLAHFSSGAGPHLDDFVEFARTLPAPDIYDLTRNAEPLDQAAMIQFPASVRRRYEKLPRFPQGYLVMGDALSSFNPIYGQGMTVAAFQALELEAALGEGLDDLARRFFARAAGVIDVPWNIAVGNDLRMPETKGTRPLAVRLINRYMARLHRAAHQDPAVALAFHRVGNLLDPPAAILHPRIVGRVLRRALAGAPKPRGAKGAFLPSG